jgi:hypothetical protein
MDYRERIYMAASEASSELARLSCQDIEIKSAIQWAGRAMAASMQGRHMVAEDYYHEAIEHAALSGDDELLRTIRGLKLS